MMPPHMIISSPVQSAVCESRRVGALVVLVSTQLSVPGLYLPPVFKRLVPPELPPQTIISLPVHTAVGEARAEGASARFVEIQVSPVQTPEGSDITGSV